MCGEDGGHSVEGERGAEREVKAVSGKQMGLIARACEYLEEMKEMGDAEI